MHRFSPPLDLFLDWPNLGFVWLAYALLDVVLCLIVQQASPSMSFKSETYRVMIGSPGDMPAV